MPYCQAHGAFKQQTCPLCELENSQRDEAALYGEDRSLERVGKADSLHELDGRTCGTENMEPKRWRVEEREELAYELFAQIMGDVTL